ncbi:hypothetical protein [[Phormidium] sp. ETS-05]|nr:hypothetical protein [[Phormidium] sp. ETS-05]
MQQSQSSERGGVGAFGINIFGDVTQLPTKRESKAYFQVDHLYSPALQR